MNDIIIILFIIFFSLLIINMPIAFVLGVTGIISFLILNDMSLIIAAQKIISPTQSFTFLAVPFFLIAGNIMNHTGITKRIVKFATIISGHMVGGLAQVSLIVSALMGGISGSAVADAAMEARFLGPSMIKSGYSKGFTSVVLSFGGLITATIPPSLGLIVYGYIGEVSIGKLFVAGIIPGILLTIIFMVTTHFISIKRGYKPIRQKAPDFNEILESTKDSIWALLFPILLIFGIRFGIFTPSEAGAFAIVYAIIIGKYVHKELKFKELFKILDSSIKDNGNIMAIVTYAGIFGFVSPYIGIPQVTKILLMSISNDRYIILITILTFLLIMGMLMEATVNTLLFTPIFLPVIIDLGFDPIFYGILQMTIITSGCMTPPVAVSMFSVCSILECPTSDYIRECIPYIISIIIFVLVLIIFPDIILFLPNQLYPK